MKNDDYYEFKRKLSIVEKEMSSKLEQLLQRLGYDGWESWFNFKADKLTIVWTFSTIPMETIREYEKEFGEIEKIKTSDTSNNLFIVFKGSD